MIFAILYLVTLFKGDFSEDFFTGMLVVSGIELFFEMVFLRSLLA